MATTAFSCCNDHAVMTSLNTQPESAVKVKDIISQHNMQQMVRKLIRGQKVFDIFLTNCPHLWNRPNIFDGVVKSDHLAVVITPWVAVKPERKTVYFTAISS